MIDVVFDLCATVLFLVGGLISLAGLVTVRIGTVAAGIGVMLLLMASGTAWITGPPF